MSGNIRRLRQLRQKATISPAVPRKPIGDRPVKRKTDIIKTLKAIKADDVLSFIREEFGNDSTKLLASVTGILTAGSFYIKNPKVKKTVMGIQVGVSGLIFGIELATKIANYAKSRNERNDDTYSVYCKNVGVLLGYDEENTDVNDIDDYQDIRFDEALVRWLCSSPKTERIKIHGMYRVVGGTQLQPISGVHSENSAATGEKEASILIVCQDTNDGVKFAIRLDYGMFGTSLIVSASNIMGKNMWNNINGNNYGDTLHNLLLREYISSLDVSNTIIRFDLQSIKSHPRRSCPVTVNQFPVEYFVKEITEVLSSKRRRAVVLAGRQGVGKSSIIRYIEDTMRDHMIFHLSPKDFDNADMLRMRFDVISSYQPVILVIEDLDSCGLERKNNVVGVFLDQIDEVNKNLNIFIIVTINDTSAVHSTIIDRPGRFDRVIEVLPPQTIEEVDHVVRTKMNIVHKNYFPNGALMEIIDGMSCTNMKDFYQKCIDSDYTQAEITEAVVEQAIIDIKLSGAVPTKMEFMKCLYTSIDKHSDTKRVLTSYKKPNEKPLSLRHSFVDVVRDKYQISTDGESCSN